MQVFQSTLFTVMGMFVCLSHVQSRTIQTTEEGQTLQQISQQHRQPIESLVKMNKIASNIKLPKGFSIHLNPSDDKHDLSRSKQSMPNLQSKMKTTSYAYYSNGAPIQDGLTGFASNYGIPLKISKHINNVMNGSVGPLDAVSFINLFSRINQLVWYFDGNTLYVYNSNEIKTELLNLNFINTTELKNTLTHLKYWDHKFGWIANDKDGFISISGPPRYIELIKNTAKELESSAENRAKNKLDFITFPLKHASASDRTINYRNQSILIPGVASILNNMLFDSNDSITTSTMHTNDVTHSKSLNPAPSIQTDPTAQKKSISSSKGVNNKNIKIQAEPRSNSILVYDLSSKKSMYQKLISLLDKPSAQIEINVSIIDIDTNSFGELGINWSLTDPTSPNQTTAKFEPSEFNASKTILNLAHDAFSFKLKALSTNKKAKILSRPSVITLDNMEAILDNSQTFYVPVVASKTESGSSALYPITTGSVLKVRPRIISERNNIKIQLDVDIQDGSSQNSDLGGVSLPIVKNTTINTQAIVSENESLLVGGYYYEKRSNTHNKVPVLSSIPFFGKLLFKDRAKTYTKNVRLFLITPKVIKL